MIQHDLLGRSIDVGKDMTQWTQERVESFLRDLASNAEDQAAQAQQLIADLVERSMSNTEALVEALDREIRAQLKAVGVATKSDIARLERRIETLLGRSPASSGTGARPTTAAASAPAAKRSSARPATPKSATKKSAGKKSAAKKSASAKKSAAKKSAAKKSVAKKSVAKKSAAKKSVAKKSAAKKSAAKKTGVESRATGSAGAASAPSTGTAGSAA